MSSKRLQHLDHTAVVEASRLAWCLHCKLEGDTVVRVEWEVPCSEQGRAAHSTEKCDALALALQGTHTHRSLWAHHVDPGRVAVRTWHMLSVESFASNASKPGFPPRQVAGRLPAAHLACGSGPRFLRWQRQRHEHKTGTNSNARSAAACKEKMHHLPSSRRSGRHVHPPDYHKHLGYHPGTHTCILHTFVLAPPGTRWPVATSAPAALRCPGTRHPPLSTLTLYSQPLHPPWMQKRYDCIPMAPSRG